MPWQMLPKSKVKYIQSLGHKKFRDEADVFLLEGPRLVSELLLHGRMLIQEIFALPDWVAENRSLLQSLSEGRVNIISAEELKKISGQQTPNRVLAVASKLRPSQPLSLTGKLSLFLDDMQDPGNLGTIIRTADWFGIEQVICSAESADLYNPKVVQATMGSLFRVSVHYVHKESWIESIPSIPVVCTALSGQDLFSCAPLSEGLIVIGNEGRGISDLMLSRATVKVTIPRYGGAESLNAAVAAGIVMARFCRSV